VPLQLRNDCAVGMVHPPSAQIRRWDWGVQINEQNDDARLRNYLLVQQPDPKQFQFLTDGRAVDGCLIANGTNLTMDKMSNAELSTSCPRNRRLIPNSSCGQRAMIACGRDGFFGFRVRRIDANRLAVLAYHPPMALPRLSCP